MRQTSIDMLYNQIMDLHIFDNPFTTAESERLFDECYNAYVNKNLITDFDMETLLMKLVATECRTAFKVGFNTAVKLFTIQ